MTDLRFITRDGQKVLQFYRYSEMPMSGWEDVPHIDEPPKAKEFWLIAGRYFESKDDAEMWAITNACKSSRSLKTQIIHVKEVL